MGSIRISEAFIFDITRSSNIQLGSNSSLSGSKQVNGAWWIFRIGEERVKLARASPPELTLHLERKPRIAPARRQDLPAGPYDPEIGLVEERETASRLRAGEEIEALEQQPQNTTRDPMGRNYYDPFLFQYRNQHCTNRDRDHAKSETGPPLAPKPVSVVQRRLNKSSYDEVRGAYGGNQAANNQQPKIGAGHVGESRSEQTERKNLVKNNVGSQ
jgi:hypothetical protein